MQRISAKGDPMSRPKPSYRFISNPDCRYFPCHKTSRPEQFNCLFCFCPLYFLDQCGGRFTRLKSGHKDCSRCMIPHTPEGYDYVLKKLRECFQRPCRLCFDDAPAATPHSAPHQGQDTDAPQQAPGSQDEGPRLSDPQDSGPSRK
jgi:Zn-finger protein